MKMISEGSCDSEVIMLKKHFKSEAIILNKWPLNAAADQSKWSIAECEKLI